jgi:uncharacterized protein (UPF0335 family)
VARHNNKLTREETRRIFSGQQLYILNEESESFTFHNRRGSSNVDLTIANSNLIADVKEWEVSPDESLSDHRYLKYNIGREINKRFNKENNSQQIRYIIKENKYQDYDRKLVKEIMKIGNNTDFKGGEEELDKTISTIVLWELYVHHVLASTCK